MPTNYFNREKSSLYFALLVTLIFIFLGFVFINNHIMWRDEIQAWLLARDSKNYSELFGNLKYEGHPAIWYLCLKFLNHFSSSSNVMQYFHLSIASANIYIFTKYSPFSRLQKVLFTFGYFPIFEYAIISRSYALSILFMLIFLTLYKRRYSLYIPIGLILLLLSNTSVHGLIIAIIVLVILSKEVYSKELFKRQNLKIKIFAFLLISGIGVMISIIQLIPSSDSNFANEWLYRLEISHIERTANALLNAYFPLPPISNVFWNRNVLNHGFYKYIFGTITIGVFIFIAYRLKASSVAFNFFILTSIGISLFFYTKYSGSLRHHGFLFFILIGALWLFFEKRSKKTNDDDILSKLVTAILCVHLIAGILALILIQKYSFSESKAVAHFLKAQQLEHSFIVAYPDYTASSILGYLDKRTLYYPNANREGSFVRWDTNRLPEMTMEDVISKSQKIADSKKQKILVLLKDEINYQNLPPTMKKLKEFNDPIIVTDEKFFLYSLNPSKLK